MFELLGVFFILLLFLYVPYAMRTTKHGAPFVPMEASVVGRVMTLTEVGSNDVFYELGSGDGRLVIAAALRGAKSFGIEVDFLRVLYSRVWIFLLRLKNAAIIHGDIFKVDLSQGTVICSYLLPETNEKLEPKLERELAKGTRVVSVGFEFPNWKPVRVDPRGTIYGPIYLYQI